MQQNWHGITGTFKVPEKFTPLLTGGVNPERNLIAEFYGWARNKELRNSAKIEFRTTPAHVRARATHTGSSFTPDGDSTHKGD